MLVEAFYGDRCERFEMDASDRVSAMCEFEDWLSFSGDVYDRVLLDGVEVR